MSSPITPLTVASIVGVKLGLNDSLTIQELERAAPVRVVADKGAIGRAGPEDEVQVRGDLDRAMTLIDTAQRKVAGRQFRDALSGKNPFEDRSDRDALIQRFRGIVDEIMTRPAGSKVGWTCDWGQCMPLSYQLRNALEENDVNCFDIVYVKGPGFDVRGKRVTQDLLPHAFLADRTDGDEQEIIIDPTYLQFFEKGSIDAPPVFFGTRDELVALFEANADKLKVGQLFMRQKTDLSPADLNIRQVVDHLYGFEAGREKYVKGTKRTTSPI